MTQVENTEQPVFIPFRMGGLLQQAAILANSLPPYSGKFALALQQTLQFKSDRASGGLTHESVIDILDISFSQTNRRSDSAGFKAAFHFVE